MLGLKGMLGVGAIGAAASVFLWGMWKNEQAKVANLNTKVELLQQQIMDYQAVIEEQKRTAETFEQILKLNQETIDGLEKDNRQAYLEAEGRLQEIDRLRAREPSMAIDLPYERGNAATDRLNCIMQRISGETCAAVGSDQRSQLSESDNPAGT